MLDTINHRGPDSKGKYLDREVSLGHARLSVIDLSEDSGQPMVSRDGRFVIVYNGEIYNYQSLKGDLESEGVTFRTKSDTEVLLEGFALWGEKVLPKLNGMFAFAVYDRLNRTVTIARDRFGIKPVYYYFNGDFLVFGSEIKSLVASNLFSSNICFQGLHEYLHFGTTLGETTFYNNIKKLEPGNLALYEIDEKDIQIRTFFSIGDESRIDNSLNVAVRTIRELFEDSIRRQLVSDVPVGVFLSGGIDSTAITAFASKHYGGKLKTFSAGFDFDRGVNELPNARFVAQYFNTDHHELHIKGEDVADTLDTLSSCFDQPFGDAANIPLYLMSKAVGGDHKVILQGDGGDELFAGYSQYVRVKREKLFLLISIMAKKMGFLVPKSSKYYRMMRSFYAMAQSDRELVPARFYSSVMVNEKVQKLFKSRLGERLDRVDPFLKHRSLHSMYGQFDLLQEMLYTDVRTILPDLYLEKVDRATMANSIEVRVPFLDNDLASYAMRLPSSYKVRGKEKKFLLKKAFSGIVPDHILYGAKRGFSVPFGYWLRTSLRDFMVDNIRQCDLFSPDVERMMFDHIKGNRDHGFMLWKLLCLAVWVNKNKIVV